MNNRVNHNNAIDVFANRGLEYLKSRQKTAVQQIVDNLKKLNEELSSREDSLAMLGFGEIDEDKVPSNCVVPERIRYGILQIENSKGVTLKNPEIPLLLPTNVNAVMMNLSSESEKVPVLFQIIIIRLLLSMRIELVKVSVVDMDFGSSFPIVSAITNPLFKNDLIYRPEDVSRLIDELTDEIGTANRSFMGRCADIDTFNKNAGDKALPYHFVFIDDFPSGFSSQSIDTLLRLIDNGNATRAGIKLFINYDSRNQAPRDFDLKRFEKNCAWISKGQKGVDFMNWLFKSPVRTIPKLDISIPLNVQQYIDFINSIKPVEVESNDNEVLKLTDYLVKKKDWWSKKSGDMLQIPFGLSSSKQMEYLKITQESGQNSALVIGIPGSGKSIFLHTIIVNAAFNYAPDELNLYLIDFSGVEFNIYALHHLPHAKIIAPEAEREFGLSVLRGLLEEGQRRMNLCREHEVSNIVELREAAPQLKIPRLLVIIDEFQKFFEIENDAISREASSIIHTIIQEFRKFGINLILATQKLSGTASVLPKDLVANRILFKSAPSDFTTLISLPMGEKLPTFTVGSCIYNSNSGSPEANIFVKTFFAGKTDRETLLGSLETGIKERGLPAVSDTIVFRSAEQPEIQNRRKLLMHSMREEFPAEVGIYIGESISLQDYDVCVPLVPSSNNNILIIGGGKNIDVAEQITLNSALLAMDAHTDGSASFRFLNFMKSATNPLYSAPQDYFANGPFESIFASKQVEVNKVLADLKSLIEERTQSEEQLHNVYMFIFDFQLGRMFDKGGRRGDDVSEEGQLLDFVLKRGPQVNVFTILQVDTLDNLNRIGSQITVFQHKIALQMEENESIRIIGSGVANKLFVMNRPASKYRAYYCDKSMNILTKFKPYK